MRKFMLILFALGMVSQEAIAAKSRDNGALWLAGGLAVGAVVCAVQAARAFESDFQVGKATLYQRFPLFSRHVGAFVLKSEEFAQEDEARKAGRMGLHEHLRDCPNSAEVEVLNRMYAHHHRASEQFLRREISRHKIPSSGFPEVWLLSCGLCFYGSLVALFNTR